MRGAERWIEYKENAGKNHNTWNPKIDKFELLAGLDNLKKNKTRRPT